MAVNDCIRVLVGFLLLSRALAQSVSFGKHFFQFANATSSPIRWKSYYHLNTSSLFACALPCLLESGCSGILFVQNNTETGQCQLYQTSNTSTLTKDEAEKVFYIVRECPSTYTRLLDDTGATRRYHFYIYPQPQYHFSWTDARKECIKFKGRLAEIETKEEFLALREYLYQDRSHISKDIWIGGINHGTSAHDLEFRWDASGDVVDNSAITWVKNEPNSKSGTNGMRFWSGANFYMDDYFVYDKCHFICECY